MMIESNILSQVALGSDNKVTIAYDNNDLSSIFVLSKQSNEFIKCKMVDKDLLRMDCMLTERDIISVIEEYKKAGDGKKINDKAAIQKFNVFDEINAETSDIQVSKSDFSDIEAQRNDEKTRRRQDSAFTKNLAQRDTEVSDSKLNDDESDEFSVFDILGK
jgi:hypothetical protein